MQLHTVIDDNLIHQAKQLSGLQTEREIIEAALRLWLKIKQAETKPETSDAEAAFALSGFIGCAHGDPLLSERYKERLTDSLRNKHGYR